MASGYDVDNTFGNENRNNNLNSNMQNSNMTSYSAYLQESEQERSKRRTVKKILIMSTMDKNIQKLLLRILQGGKKSVSKNMSDEVLDKLLKYADSILDKENHQELEKCLNDLHANPDTINDNFLKIIKFFVLSPIEKQYIVKIEKEIQEGEALDMEIQAVERQIKEEKDKKVKKLAEEKVRKPKGVNKTDCESLLQQISIHENKLEKSNQKLNKIVAQNNQLREKINQLRKEKNFIEDIYDKLQKELEQKKANVEETINAAQNAYISRNQAEEELQQLQKKAEQQKQDFEKEYKELNKNIQYDKRFKEFIKSKQKEKEILENLEAQIAKNDQIIKEKTKYNEDIDNEYKLSAEKEEEIKNAFERIKKETGINSSKEEETQKLLQVFIDLYNNNAIMSKFVEELTEEVESLEKQIQEKKEQIQLYSTKGATTDNQRRELKIQLLNKIQQEEKKKAILKTQYEKSIETINLIKGYLENVFQAIDVEPEIIEKLKISAITEENMIYFLGILEQKGIDAISEYSRLIAEQLKIEKSDVPGIAQQIDDLNNIIAYENANIMNYYSTANQNKDECPDDLLNIEKKEDDNNKDENKFMQQEDFRDQALKSLEKKFFMSNQGGKLNNAVNNKITSNSIKSPNKSIKK